MMAQTSMTPQEMEKFVKEKVSIATLLFLFNYKEFGLGSRQFMLNEHGKVLRALLNREDHFASYPGDTITFLESRFYLETLERLCQLIEDFCVITEGVADDPRRLPNVLINHGSPQNFLKNCDRPLLAKSLKLPSTDDLPIDGREKELLEVVREKNFQVLDKFVALLKKFLDLNWLSYIKYKHGNSLIYGLSHDDINGERLLSIPVVYNSEDPSQTKAIIVNARIHGLWVQIFNTLCMLTMDIVQRNIDYAETGGSPIPEQILYFKADEDTRQAFRDIVTKCTLGVTRTSIAVRIETKLPSDVLNRHLELFQLADLGSFNES